MPLRRVDVKFASAAALGILVPPGARTYVVVRPRGMMWDFLPVRWSGQAGDAPEFASFDRDEAAVVARGLAKTLDERDRLGTSPLETLGHESAFQVWMRDVDLCWLLCERIAGRPYRPLVFATLDEARAAAAIVAPFVHPGAERVQDYYFNTQNFS